MNDCNYHTVNTHDLFMIIYKNNNGEISFNQIRNIICDKYNDLVQSYNYVKKYNNDWSLLKIKIEIKDTLVSFISVISISIIVHYY